MLSKSTIIIFGGMLLFFNTTLRADTQRINLHDAINKTFEHNPALRAFSHELKAQEGRQLQAALAASWPCYCATFRFQYQQRWDLLPSQVSPYSMAWSWFHLFVIYACMVSG